MITLDYDRIKFDKNEKLDQKIILILKNALVFLTRWIYREVFGYGSRYFTVPITILYTISLSCVLFFIASFYGGLQYEHIEMSQCTICGKLFHAVYFSFITYATVGYGDIAAVHGWRIIAIVEGLLGVFLNAAFIIVFFRQLVR
jgi:hypothetical protein